MLSSFLLQTEHIEDIHYINNSDAKKLCSLLNIELDIFYDKYSNMEITYQICEKYDFEYSFVEKFHGYYEHRFTDDKKLMLMKSDRKDKVFSPIFFHELGHFLESNFFHTSATESLLFTNIKKDMFSEVLEQQVDEKAIKEITEYIAHIFGLFIASRIDALSGTTNYFYSYYQYYKNLDFNELKGIGDVLFFSFIIENEQLVNLLKKATYVISEYDYEYIEFLKITLYDLLNKLNLDFHIYQRLFDEKIKMLQENKSICFNEALLTFLKNTK